MIFGIKTKKDKRIEELEGMLFVSKLEQPMPLKIEHNIVALGASQILEDGMPVEYAKERIARLMVDEIESHIYYDVVDDGRWKVLKGYIRVVIEK